MSALIENMNLAIAFACFILGLHLLRVRSAESSMPVLLALTFLMMSLHASLMTFVLVYGRNNIPAILLPSLALIIGPAFVLTFESMKSNFRLAWPYSLHALPAIVVFLMLVLRTVMVSIDLIILVSFLVYGLWLITKVQAGRSQFEHMDQQGPIAYRWLVCAALILSLAFISELLVLAEIHSGTSINRSTTLLIATALKLCAIVYVLLSALQRPSLFDWLYELGSQSKQQSSSPEQREAWDSLAAEFKALVQNERLFAVDGVSIKSTARRLGVPVRQLSEAINHKLQESFSKYMNRLRVAEAKRLLDESSDVTITNVMYDSGFRTKSNFNKEFRALVGLSPTEYREKRRVAK